MKTKILFIAAALMLVVSTRADLLSVPLPGSYVAPPPVTNLPTVTVTGGLKQILQAIRNGTNTFVEINALYAPGLHSKYGGDIGAYWLVNDYVYTGVRVSYVDGGFWMPSGNAALQVPTHPFSWISSGTNFWTKIKMTPFGFAGIGIPLSGSKVGTVTIPGSVRDNQGQPTAILGFGAAITFLENSKGTRFSLVGDQETWSGFDGTQYRFGFALSGHLPWRNQ